MRVSSHCNGNAVLVVREDIRETFVRKFIDILGVSGVNINSLDDLAFKGA